MTDIGKTTRRETITKWRTGIQKNTELLLAFPVEQIEDDNIAVFRADVARRIEDLSVYLATGEWSLFLDTPLTFPEPATAAPSEVVDVMTTPAKGDLILIEDKSDATPIGGKPKKRGKKGGKA